MATTAVLPAPDPKPPCQLVGLDGNVFSVIGAVSRALRRAGYPDHAREFPARAMACGSYDDVLALVFEYVEAF